ncbi:MAG: MoxR family ATPase [Bacteroides sp.]|nr:MoxR family ATPase [Bacteroides sp.]
MSISQTSNIEEERIQAFSDKISQLKQEIAKTVVGQEDNIEMILTAILANGHILIEGMPGVAKTLTTKLIAKLIDASFNRIQFTPDLMPSDVVGTTVYNMKEQEFSFHRGPVFANIVLADEINRAPAKTQAALLEAMEERQVTVDGNTYPMERLYTILATQNPIEQEGTYRLPEAQLDRFVMKINMDYPQAKEELEILKRYNANQMINTLEHISPILTPEEIINMRQLANDVYVDDSLIEYIVNIIQQTRNSKNVYLGASTRATVAILKVSKAYALIQGRDFVTPEDIKHVAPYIIKHRITITAEAEMEGYTPEKVTTRLIERVHIPEKYNKQTNN